MPKRKNRIKLDPKIVELRNEITGETKWRVFAQGRAQAHVPPFLRDFDTREEAIACYADNFGWRAVDDFQPEPPKPLGVFRGEN